MLVITDVQSDQVAISFITAEVSQEFCFTMDVGVGVHLTWPPLLIVHRLGAAYRRHHSSSANALAMLRQYTLWSASVSRSV